MYTAGIFPSKFNERLTLLLDGKLFKKLGSYTPLIYSGLFHEALILLAS